MMTMDHREQSQMAAKWERIWSPTRMTYEVQGAFHFEGELEEGAKLRVCRNFEDGGIGV